MNRLVLGEALEELIDYRGKTPKKLGADFTQSGVPVASALLVDNGVLDLSGARFVSEETYRKWMSIPTRQGDVLLTSEAPLGRVARVPSDDPLVLGQRLYGLRGREGVLDNGFLFYALQTEEVKSDLLGRSTGTTVFGIRQSALRQVRISAPHYKEQQAIAEVLGAFDEKIAANTKLAETSAQLAQAIFAHSIQADSQEVLLSEVTDLISRGITPKYSDDLNAMTVLNQKCVRGLRVDLVPSRRTDRAKVRHDKVLIPNDVLVNSTGQGTLGRVARWTLKEEATVDSHITILRFNSTKVDPVCAGFSLLRMQDVIEAMGEGSTGQTELSRGELGKLRVRLPKSEAQQVLGDRLSALAAMENAHLAENLSLAFTRDLLLPRLISGKLHVQEAEAVVESIV